MKHQHHNILQLMTPEGVVFHLPLAGAVSRFLAWLLDFFCIMVIHTVLRNLLSILNLVSMDLYQGVLIISFFAISILYGMILEWFWAGQTIGKRVLRLRVLDAQGLRLRFSQVAVRNLLRFVDLLPAAYLLGGVTLVISRHNTRIGDIAANTVVVVEEKTVKPDLAQVLPDKFNSLKAYPHLCARLRQKIGQNEADLALSALFRRAALDPAERVRVFESLARHFRAQVPFPQEATQGVPDEQYIRNVIEVLYKPEH